VRAAAELKPGPVISPLAAAMVALGTLARRHQALSAEITTLTTQLDRLNRGGDRQANAALYRIVLVRLRWHQPTRDYLTRRTAQGKTRKEIIRCLKRYVAREVFAALNQTSHDTLTPAA
jgi:hypothetical protein